MTEYRVHFQKGHKIGTRSLRIVDVSADTAHDAAKQAKRLRDDLIQGGYRVVRVDHFDETTGRTVID